jgi:hypothetical protein
MCSLIRWFGIGDSDLRDHFAIELVVSESSWTFIAVTASVKEEERGGQDHTPENLLHESVM